MSCSEPSQPPSLLLAASFHRSGSTLLQRYITAATDIFMWGENGRLVPALRSAVEEWPQESHNRREYSEAMDDPTVVERTFVPNLAPPADRVLDALRTAVCDIYRTRPRHFERWGWKAVRYGRDDIELVRTLFPEIDVVLLVRDPWDVARSVRRKGWIDKRGYFEDIEQVARQWAERTASYVELASVDDDRVHFVQYEHLHDRIGRLDAFLGVREGSRTWDEISRRKLGTAPTFSRFSLTAEDVEAIASIAGDVASGLGYSPPSLSTGKLSELL